jgi:predicted nucleotidyltransferase
MESVIEALKGIDVALDDKIPERYREDIKKSYNCLKKYGCESVYLFGSLVTGKINDNSDIDIGVKGLPPEKFFSVYSYLDFNLDNGFDLVDFDFNSDFFSLLDRLGEVIKIGQ